MTTKCCFLFRSACCIGSGPWVCSVKSLSSIFHWIHTFCLVKISLPCCAYFIPLFLTMTEQRKRPKQIYLEVTGRWEKSWFLKLCPLRLALPLVTWASFTSAVMEGENPYLLRLENPRCFYPCSQVTDIYLVWNLLFCRHSQGVCSEKLMFGGFGFVFLKLFLRQLWCKPQCTTMGIRGYYFKSQFCHLLAVWHWPDLLFSEFPFPHLKNKN